MKALAGAAAELIRATAYHEAAHTVVGWRYGKKLLGGGVVVNLDAPGEGATHTHASLILPLARLPEEMRPVAQRRLRAECIEFLAGYTAEHRAMGRRGVPPLGSDALRATMLIMRAHGCIQVVAELHLRLFARSAQRLVRRPEIWSAIEALAERLIRHGRLPAAEVEAVFNQLGLKPVPPHYFRVGAAVVATQPGGSEKNRSARVRRKPQRR